MFFKVNFRLGFFIFILSAIFFLGKDNACEAAPNLDRNTPTRIRSDIIDIKQKSQTIDFLGNVVVEKDDSSMLASKMTVLYEREKTEKKPAPKKILTEEEGVAQAATPSQEEQKGDSKIKRIDAYDNVKIFSEDFVGSGDYGYFDPLANLFVLEKNVIVNNGASLASGDKFIYDLKTKKGNFVGRRDETSIAKNNGEKRVVVIIGEDSKGKKKDKNE